MARERTVTDAYGDDAPSAAVARAVAVATDRSVVGLDPLYETIDTDALDGLFSHGGRPQVSFRYENCEVTVTARRVVVRPDERIVDSP